MIRNTQRYDSVSVNCQVLNVFSVMSRCYKKLIIKALKRAHIKLKFVSRDYLLHPPSTAIATAHQQNAKIGKNDDKTDKPEKKEKKIKEMSESRVKKFQKLFGQQVTADEKLINYFSCALVADILLQGHLYVSENYFSFYSNVFGYVTKLVIPIITVTSITREKTAKFFPNAIALQLSDGKHVFGSFLSRETAYQLMSSIHGKIVLSIEPAADLGEIEVDNDEIDGEMLQDVEVSSLEDSSSISGNESPAQYKLPTLIDAPSREPSGEATVGENSPPIMAKSIMNDIPVLSLQTEPIKKAGSIKVKVMSEFKLLFVGICLTILLAFFSGLLLLKINAIEKNNQQSNTPFDFDSKAFTIDDAESILNKNLLIVQSVRRKLEDLQDLLQSSFDKFPSGLDEKQEL